MKKLVFAIALLAACKKSAPAPPTTETTLATVTTAAIAPVPDAGVQIAITPSELRVEDARVLSLPPPERAAAGIDATSKRNGPADLYLVPLGNALAAQKGKPAIVTVDARTPYRVFVEVAFTLGQSEITPLHIVVTKAGQKGVLDGDAPRVRIGKPQPLSIGLFADGITMHAKEGNLGKDCVAGPGLAVPNRDGKYDFAALAVCSAKLGADEVVLTAAPNTDFQSIVSAMEALHTRVSFGPPR